MDAYIISIWLHQKGHKIVWYNECKTCSYPLGTHFKLKSIVSLEKFDFIKKTFYSNVIDSLMYVIIGIRLDIADLISLISKFMSKSCKEQDIEAFAFSTIWIYW